MPNYNPYFSNVVRPSSGGLRTGGLAHKIIGGIADEGRAQRSYEYASKLIQERTVGDIVTHMINTHHTSEAEKTDAENRREHYKNLTNDIHSHLSPEERAAAGIGKIDPFLVGGKDFQQLGQSKEKRRILPTNKGILPTNKGIADPADAMNTYRNDDSSFTDDDDDTSLHTEPTSEPTSEPSEDTQSTKRPTMTSLKRKEAAHLKQLADAKAAGPTADKGPDQPVKPTRRRKKSAAEPTADTSTSTALSSKSIAEDISKNNGDE